MKEYGQKKGLKLFLRDSKNVFESDAVVLISVTAKPPLGINCGMCGCLLYTSDAADDLLCVDLGGRRIIKKKKTKSRQPATHV